MIFFQQQCKKSHSDRHNCIRKNRHFLKYLHDPDVTASLMRAIPAANWPLFILLGRFIKIPCLETHKLHLCSIKLPIKKISFKPGTRPVVDQSQSNFNKLISNHLKPHQTTYFQLTMFKLLVPLAFSTSTFAAIASNCTNFDCNAPNGNCTILNAAPTCVCSPPYTGANCAEDWCTSSGNTNCGLNAVCKNSLTAGGYYCDCNVGWEGLFCDQKACTDRGTAAENGACTCDAGFTGYKCQFEERVCQNNGTLTAIQNSVGTCECGSSFLGENCETAKVVCGENGDWVGPNGCFCEEGFTGDNCENSGLKIISSLILIGFLSLIVWKVTMRKEFGKDAVKRRKRI